LLLENNIVFYIIAIFILIHSIVSFMKDLQGVEESIEELQKEEQKENQNA